MCEALPDLLSIYIDRPRDRATRVLLIQPNPVAAFAEGLSPALPGHTFLRSLAMSWASALGSYGSSWGAASFCKSARRRSEEHTSELQSRLHLVCRLLLEK